VDVFGLEVMVLDVSGKLTGFLVYCVQKCGGIDREEEVCVDDE
jgi:hypothetical protein